MSDAARRRATLAAVREDREAMHRFADMRDLDVWYARFDVELAFQQWRSRVTKRQVDAYQAAVANAHRNDSMRALSRLTHHLD